MELDWLETFLAVVDRGGFTAASAQVHRSQSRVSAHIAGLERELGVQLIDRTRRPATLTAAGQVFAGHAREILVGVGSARSAIGALRAMNSATLGVLTTACIGSSLFPGVIADLLARYPRARVALSERGRQGGDQPVPADGFLLAVLPTLGHRSSSGLTEQVLWREPLQVLVPADHPLATESGRHGTTISPDQLARFPLIVGGVGGAEPEFVAMMASRAVEIRPTVVVDVPQTLVALVRAGLGVGIADAVAIDNADTAGLVALSLDDAELIREVAVYWYDALLRTEYGQALLQAVLQAPLPKGAIAAGRSDWQPGQ